MLSSRQPRRRPSASHAAAASALVAKHPRCTSPKAAWYRKACGATPTGSTWKTPTGWLNSSASPQPVRITRVHKQQGCDRFVWASNVLSSAPSASASGRLPKVGCIEADLKVWRDAQAAARRFRERRVAAESERSVFSYSTVLHKTAPKVIPIIRSSPPRVPPELPVQRYVNGRTGDRRNS